MTRTLAVLVPRWPITAAGVDQDTPACAFKANRVVAASVAAAEAGIAAGMRRREAQSRCPEIEVLPHDPDLDARTFESVVEAVERFSPRVEIVRPGLCVLAARGPARYFGGEEALAAEIREAVDGARVGIADSVFAAALAARRDAIVDDTPAFLAPHPVDVLPALGDVLTRLGIRTLGDLAALPTAKVAARFGASGVHAHELARGLDPRPLAPREPPPDLTVTRELDPPAASLDQATFHAKAAADELAVRLGELGLACAKLEIHLATEHGEERTRTWRYSGAFTPLAIAERVRWQVDGWLGSSDPPTAPVTLLRLHPQDVGLDVGSQVGFWGRPDDVSDRVRRALHRVQGLLGHTGVVRAVASGGRSFAEQVTLVGWGDPLEPERPGLPGAETVAGPVTVEMPPWPGRIAGPPPALVEGRPVEVTDARGAPVGVTGRFCVTAPPARVGHQDVVSWAGPWPSDERWWDTDAHRRRARIQVVLSDGTAHLLAIEGGRWSVEATYD